MDIHTNINGKTVVWRANPGENLLDVLRREGFVSVKRGCSEGDCGACTILLDGSAQRACLLLAGQVEGRRLMTVEALGTSEEPHVLQQAFVEHGAVQCGFCTPGMLLASQALLDENLAPTREDVCEALDGNLCRCTGYVKIIEAVLDAAGRLNK